MAAMQLGAKDKPFIPKKKVSQDLYLNQFESSRIFPVTLFPKYICILTTNVRKTLQFLPVLSSNELQLNVLLFLKCIDRNTS